MEVNAGGDGGAKGAGGAGAGAARGRAVLRVPPGWSVERGAWHVERGAKTE